MPFGCIWLVVGSKQGGLALSVAIDMGEAAHNGCNGADGGSRAVVVDCGIVGTSFAIVKLEWGSSAVLKEVRFQQSRV